MSLRWFHRVFIAVCVAVLLFSGLVCFWQADEGSFSELKILGGLCISGVPILVGYFIWFSRKAMPA
jgi:hypothetical protein